MKILVEKKVIDKALEALLSVWEDGEAITAFRQAIEEAEKVEPVGEVLNERGEIDWISFVPPAGASLYTAPPPRQPLTDEEIVDIVGNCAADSGGWFRYHAFARAIEAAHGITGESE